MPNRMQWILLIAASLALVVGVAFLPPFSVKERRLKSENFSRVMVGMSLNEVEELLGGPAGNYAVSPSGICEMTDEGKPYLPGTVEKLWFDENHMLEIYFDAKDRVASLHKRAHFKQHPRQSWFSGVWDSLRGFVSPPARNAPWAIFP